nr:3759_t:CDS:2 [Entrophospora candida]
MSGLTSTIAAFKNTIATQEVIPKPRISPNNNNNTSLNGSKSALSTNKRKPKKSGFSQPVDTGPAEHTLSQFHREKMDEPQTLEEINANKFKIRPNDELYNIMISSEKIEFDSANQFVKMFHSVKVPDETDLKKSLEDAGLQSMAVFENRGIIEDKPKQRKRKLNSRKTKITNTHLDKFLMPTK